MTKTVKCLFSIGINQVNATIKEKVEIEYWEDYDRDDSIADAYGEWLAEHNTGGWEIIEEEK